MMREVSDITKRNVRVYDDALSVREYTRESGLWPIEATLIAQFFSPPPALVLDLGCGAGRTTVGAARVGYTAIGVDLSTTLLAEARKRYRRLDFLRMDASTLAFPSAVFDAALFSYNGLDCLYPLAARVRCLEEVFRVLRPGGRFMFSSHNLIGAIFSGGYVYLRGYWNAAKTLAAQLTNRVAREWFIRYAGDGGTHLLYSAPPGRTIRQLECVGFKLIHVCGRDSERNYRAICMHEPHIQFVAEKPL